MTSGAPYLRLLILDLWIWLKDLYITIACACKHNFAKSHSSPLARETFSWRWAESMKKENSLRFTDPHKDWELSPSWMGQFLHCYIFLTGFRTVCSSLFYSSMENSRRRLEGSNEPFQQSWAPETMSLFSKAVHQNQWAFSAKMGTRNNEPFQQSCAPETMSLFNKAVHQKQWAFSAKLCTSNNEPFHQSTRNNEAMRWSVKRFISSFSLPSLNH
jgi:hypothetical protein